MVARQTHRRRIVAVAVELQGEARRVEQVVALSGHHEAFVVEQVIVIQHILTHRGRHRPATRGGGVRHIPAHVALQLGIGDAEHQLFHHELGVAVEVAVVVGGHVAAVIQIDGPVIHRHPQFALGQLPKVGVGLE